MTSSDSEEDIKARLTKVEAVINSILGLQRLPLRVGGEEVAAGISSVSQHCNSSQSTNCFAQ